MTFKCWPLYNTRRMLLCRNSWHPDMVKVGDGSGFVASFASPIIEKTSEGAQLTISLYLFPNVVETGKTYVVFDNGNGFQLSLKAKDTGTMYFGPRLTSWKGSNEEMIERLAAIVCWPNVPQLLTLYAKWEDSSKSFQMNITRMGVSVAHVTQSSVPYSAANQLLSSLTQQGTITLGCPSKNATGTPDSCFDGAFSQYLSPHRNLLPTERLAEMSSFLSLLTSLRFFPCVCAGAIGFVYFAASGNPSDTLDIQSPGSVRGEFRKFSLD